MESVESLYLRTSYPRTRPVGLPDSPLQFVTRKYAEVFGSCQRAAAYHEIFSRATIATRQALEHATFGKVRNNGKPYSFQKEIFLRSLREAIASDDFRFKTWYSIGFMDFDLVVETLEDELKIVSGPFSPELGFINNIIRYLGHDINYTAPRSIVGEGINILKEVFIDDIVRSGFKGLSIPAILRPKLTAFARDIDRYAEFIEDLIIMGESFFCPNTKMGSLPQIRGGRTFKFYGDDWKCRRNKIFICKF